MFKKIILVFAIFSLVAFNNVFAATKEDVIRAINKTYTVGEETYRLPQNIINKGVNYLNKNPLSSAQYDNILRCIDNAVALAREVGTTDISKVSREDIQRALKILTEASNSANVNLNDYLDKNIVNVPNTKNETEVKDTETKDNQIKDTETKKPVNKEEISNDKPELDNNISNNEEVQVPTINVSGDASNIDKPLGSGEASGDNTLITDELLNNFLGNDNSDEIIEKNVRFGLMILIVILLVLFLLFYLILKSRWNKIIKCVLMIIFVILIIISLVLVVLAVTYMEEIKLIYKLYYMFK